VEGDQVFQKTWKELGRDPSTIVADLSYKTGDTDFSAQMAVLSQKKPDIVWWPGQVGPYILAAQQAHALGFHPVFIGNESWDVPELTKLGGKDVEGDYFITHYNIAMTGVADNAVAKKFADTYQSEYGNVPGPNEVTGADSYNMLLTAIEKVGSTDGAKMAQAIEDYVNYPGVSGAITMGPSHNPKKPLALCQVKNGARVYIFTVPPRTSD